MSGHGGTSGNDSGLEEAVSIILMAILVIAVAGIILSIVFGLVTFYPKSAYIAVKTESKNVTPGNWYLAVFHGNGDSAYLNNSSIKEGMPVDFQFTTPSGLTVFPKVTEPLTWKPGDTVYVYNKSGLLVATKDESAARSGSTGLPTGNWRFDVVDLTDHVLIYSEGTAVGNVTPTPSQKFNVTAINSPNGSITPQGVTQVSYGANQSYTITADTGYHIVSVIIDGTSVGNVSVYQFSNVIQSHTITAVFSINTYTITPSSGPGGTISPATALSVPYGSVPTFLVSPNLGFQIDKLEVDSVNVSPTGPNSYTFSPVNSNHTIAVSFKPAVCPDVTAGFTANTQTLCGGPYTVQFTDTSTGSNLSYVWSFGDGGTSTIANPVHTYASPGLYTVTLTVTNSCGKTNTIIKPNFITVASSSYSQDIEPLLSSKTGCVFSLGYKNSNSYPVCIPIGAQNKFTPGTNENRGQPTIFMPGQHNNVFSVTLSSGDKVKWHLTPSHDLTLEC